MLFNETLKDSYPRHKIKLVEDSSLPVEMKELLYVDNDYRVFEDIKQKNEMLFNEC